MRNGLRGFKQGFTSPALLRCLLRVWIAFAYAPVTLYGPPFQRIRLTTRLVTLLLQVLQPPTHRNATGLGSSDFARHYFRNRGFFLFLQVLRWFTSLGSLVPAYVFSGPFLRFAQEGFPIRTSPDIAPMCGSPKLIAACHVLHRLFLPRHPPCALSSLTFVRHTPQSLTVVSRGHSTKRSLCAVTIATRAIFCCEGAAVALLLAGWRSAIARRPESPR